MGEEEGETRTERSERIGKKGEERVEKGKMGVYRGFQRSCNVQKAKTVSVHVQYWKEISGKDHFSLFFKLQDLAKPQCCTASLP